MRNSVKGALLALTATVALVGAAVSSASSNPVSPMMVAGTGSCVTDSNGVCAIGHTLGVVPDSVVVSPNTPSPYNGYMLNTVQGSYTATSFKVRAMFTQTTPKRNGTIWISYIASVGAGPPPPSTTTPTSATTAPPSTSTVSPTPTPTTTPTPPPTSTTSPPPGACAGGAKPTVFQEQDGGDFPPYYIHNNAWNWQGSGSGQHETLYACSFSNWWVDDYGFAPSNGEVFMYPNVHQDINSGNGLPLSTWPSQITGRFAGVGPGAGSYDVAWDLWLNGLADSNSFELMVWTEKHGQADPAGTLRGTYTDPTSGQVYDVWWDGTHTNQAYLAYVSQKTQLSGTVDLRGMIVNAQVKGYLPAGDTKVNQIDYGDEVRDTQGATASSPYRFTVTDFGIMMK